jgi:hypothetical protein
MRAGVLRRDIGNGNAANDSHTGAHGSAPRAKAVAGRQASFNSAGPVSDVPAYVERSIELRFTKQSDCYVECSLGYGIAKYRVGLDTVYLATTRAKRVDGKDIEPERLRVVRVPANDPTACKEAFAACRAACEQHHARAAA